MNTEMFILEYFLLKNFNLYDLLISNYSIKVKTKSQTRDENRLCFKMIKTCLLNMSGSKKLTKN